MNIYFSRITADHWTAKNELHRKVNTLAHELDKRLIRGSELETFKADFFERVDVLNRLYPRCKPIQIQIHKDFRDSEDYFVHCSGVFQMGIYLAKPHEYF
jgi:hypothetical protein